MRDFIYQLPAQRIVFGNGSLGQLTDEAERLGITRALVISSPGRTEMAAAAAGILGGISAGLSKTASNDVTADSVDATKLKIVEAGANGADRVDGLIVLGGGSAIGLGKALGAGTGLPWIAVVTTYSGSELSSNWRVVHSDRTETGRDQTALPRTIIYDPELTVDLPSKFSAASGMNAMAHAVESLYGKTANPVTDLMATEAVRVIGATLPKINADPGNLEQRNELLYGAWLAGAFRGGLALSHRIAQCLRRAFDLSHAETHALVLPHAVAFNQAAAPDAMTAMMTALKTPEGSSAATSLYELNQHIGLKIGLKAMGVEAWNPDEATDVVLAQPFHNLRLPTPKDVRQLLDDIYEGRAPHSGF